MTPKENPSPNAADRLAEQVRRLSELIALSASQSAILSAAADAIAKQQASPEAQPTRAAWIDEAMRLAELIARAHKMAGLRAGEPARRFKDEADGHRDSLRAHLAAIAKQQANPQAKPAFWGFVHADECRVEMCFTPSTPRADGTYATAFYTTPPSAPQVPAVAQAVPVKMPGFMALEGLDQNQAGYRWRVGWNDALRMVLDYNATPSQVGDKVDAATPQCEQAAWAAPPWLRIYKAGDVSADSDVFLKADVIPAFAKLRTALSQGTSQAAATGGVQISDERIDEIYDLDEVYTESEWKGRVFDPHKFARAVLAEAGK